MTIRKNEDEIKRLYGNLIGANLAKNVVGDNLTNNKLPSQPANARWLTKDRLWNFIFWFGMTTGSLLTGISTGVGKSKQEFSYGTSLMFWLTIIGVPLLVKHCSKTIFVKDTTFLNSESKEFDVTTRVPNIFVVFISTVALTALIGAILDKNVLYISDAIGFCIFFTVLWGIPTLFFIFKNCPISILFNSKFWVWTLRQNASYSNCKRTPYIPPSSTNSSTFRPDDLIMNPIYGGLSCNIYNKYRR